MRARSSAGLSSEGASAAGCSDAGGPPTEAMSPPSRSMLEMTGPLRPPQSLTRMEKMNRSPPRLCTNPESAVTFSSVPVLARIRPAASVPSIRIRIVPSRAAMPSELTNSAATGKRFHTAESSVVMWCAEKRLVSLSPLPLRSWYVPCLIPISPSSSSVTAMPLGQVPGTPLISAPRVLMSISAMKFEDILFMSRTMSASSWES